MVTRRQVLAVGALVATTGCTAARRGAGPRTVCSGSVVDDGGAVFTLTPQVSTVGTSDTPLVVLTVPIRRSALAAEGVGLLLVRSGGATSYRIPVDPANDEPVGDVQRYDHDDVVEYSQSLGHLPQNSRFLLVALDEDGRGVDDLELEFRCHRAVDEGAGTGGTDG